MLERRGFLRGLAALPLIGGSITLIGRPTAAAVPVTRDLLDSYETWLDLERNWLRFERYGLADVSTPPLVRHEVVFRARLTGEVSDFTGMGNAGSNGMSRRGPASARAAVVLSAAGVPLTSNEVVGQRT